MYTFEAKAASGNSIYPTIFHETTYVYVRTHSVFIYRIHMLCYVCGAAGPNNRIYLYFVSRKKVVYKTKTSNSFSKCNILIWAKGCRLSLPSGVAQRSRRQKKIELSIYHARVLMHNILCFYLVRWINSCRPVLQIELI